MNNEHNITYEDMMACMDEASQSINKFCKHDINLFTNPKSNDGATRIDTLHPVGTIGYTPMQVIIGTKNLHKNMNSSGKVHNKDVIWTLQQIFHETAHVWQYSVGYMQKDASNEIKAMARDRAIGICFPEYTKTAYTLDTSELFADNYAMSQLKRFFAQKSTTDKRFLDMNINEIVCQKEFQRRGGTFPELAKCKSIDDISSVYMNQLSKLPYRKRFDAPNMMKLNNLSTNFIKLLNNGPIIEITNAANGLEESELLCEYIGRHHPDCFRSLPCIKDEYCKGSLPSLGEQITGRILGVKPQPWRELPNVHINGHQDNDDYEFK